MVVEKPLRSAAGTTQFASAVEKILAAMATVEDRTAKCHPSKSLVAFKYAVFQIDYAVLEGQRAHPGGPRG